MIPQRNTSLLANRLAKEGGRRIQESVLERDYCLAWFLCVPEAEADVPLFRGRCGGTPRSKGGGRHTSRLATGEGFPLVQNFR